MSAPVQVWSRQSAQRPYGPLQGTIVADVAIVGAGFAGLVAALELAEAGRSVVVLEAAEIGSSPSGASAGQVGPLFYGARKSPAQVTARLDAARADRLHRQVAAAGNWLFDTIAAHKIHCEARRGFLCVYRSEKSLARAAVVFTQWVPHGGRWQCVDRQALTQAIASTRYAGGIYLPDGGFLNPALLLDGLAAAAARAGAAIHENCRVSGLRAVDGGWEATCEAGSVKARRVLVVAGSAGLPSWPALARTVYPAQCGVAATAPLPDRGASLLPGGGPVADMDDKAVFAPAITADGRLMVSFLMGGGDPGLAASTWPARRRLERAFPDQRPPAFETMSWGQLALTPDGLPRLIHGDDGLLAVTGCNGFGLTLGILAAREAVRLILGAAPDALALPLSTSKPLPLPRAMPTLLRHVIAPLANRYSA